MTLLNSLFKKAGLITVGVGASVAASADSILPADLSTTVAGIQSDILIVGGLIIGLAVVAMGIRWVKATFF